MVGGICKSSEGKSNFYELSGRISVIGRAVSTGMGLYQTAC